MKNFLTVLLLIGLSGVISVCYGQWPEHTIDTYIYRPAIVHGGDIDGDSDPDVAATAYSAGGGVFWYENNLPTGWNEHTIDGTLNGAVGVFVADIDDDDTLDVVACAGGSSNDVVWYENIDGMGTSWDKHTIDENLPGAEVVYVDDIDGDNDLDVAATAHIANDVVWYENLDGMGTSWDKHTIDENLLNAITCHVADIDGDDTLDVVATGSDADDVVWYENLDGIGASWDKHTIDENLDGAWWVEAVDIDGDTDMDVIATGPDANDVVWYENAGGTPISWNKYTIDSNLGGAFVVDVVDIDGDDTIDVVATGFNADMVVWYENKGGVPINWSPPKIIDANLDGANTVFAADIDGNIYPDVFATGTYANQVVWYENIIVPVFTAIPDSLLFGNVSKGDTLIDSVMVLNTGNADLTIDPVTCSNPLFSISPTSGVISPDSNSQFYIQFRADTLPGIQQGVLVFHHNGLTSPDSIIVKADVITGIISQDATIPRKFTLHQNYPNPFNPTTAIEFSIPKSEFVILKVYNTLGEEVATLVSNRLSVGSYQYEWDASNLACGVYLCRLQAGDYVETRKMVLMK